MGKENKLESKIFDILKKLQKMSVSEMMRFDVKDGQEDGVYYHKTYVGKAQKAMGDCGGLSQSWCDMSPWQKMCVYKVSDEYGVDCDVALYSVVIYWLALCENGEGWKIREQKRKPGYYELVSKQGWILRGDTMNSYATTVREYIRKIWLPVPEHKAEMEKRGIITTTGKGWEISKKYGQCSETNYWDAAILAEYDDYFKNILPQAAETFFRLCHTIGNFTVWLADCNMPRGNGPVKDYWDLTLYHIHQWYEVNKELTTKNDALLKLFGSQLVIFQDWLVSFGTWDKFVEQNFLQDFVETDGKPKELWKNHFVSKGVKPTGKRCSEREVAGKTDFEQFFENSSKLIGNRGKKIAEAVQQRLEGENLEELSRQMAG